MNEVLFAPYRDRFKKSFFKRLLWTAASSCALGGLYALRFEDHWLRIDRHDMPLTGLGSAWLGARIAQISDLHCSPIVLERYLRQCVDAVNALDVDFVTMTGDFITGPKHYARRVARVLRGLRPKIATLACLGNHDYGIFHPRGLGGQRGLAEYLTQQLTEAGVIVVRNQSQSFSRGESKVQFVGVEDFWSPLYNPYAAFETAQANLPTIGLVHNPDAALQVAHCGAQWVLSGHTHGSGISDTLIGDLVLPSNCRHFTAGHYDLGSGRSLYVNRGLGYGRRRNVNARPEVTLFTLRDSTDVTPVTVSA